MARSLRAALIVSLIIIKFAPLASAQEKKLGLVVGYPATVGVHWQASERIGIRGEGSFSWSSSTIDDSTANQSGSSTFTLTDGTTSTLTFAPSVVSAVQETENVTGSIGVSALITLTNADQLRTYIAPRVAWVMSHSTTTIEYDLSRFTPAFLPPPGSRGFENQKITATSRTPSYGASFGATTTLRDRFGVFGEVGFAYTSTGSSPLSIGSIEINSTRESRTVSLRSGIGVTIFF